MREVAARYANVSSEIGSVRAEIESVKSRRFDLDSSGLEQSDVLKELKTALDRVNADLSVVELERSQTAYVREDAERLIEEMQRSLTRLEEGEAAAEAIGPLDFLFCPSCFNPVDPSPTEGKCRLCHSDVDGQGDRSRAAKMRNELVLQIKESRQLQEDRTSDLAKFDADIARLRLLRERFSSEYVSLSKNYLTENDARLDQLNARLGYLERELVDLDRQRRVAEQLEGLADERSQLNDEITNLKEHIQLWKSERDRRQANIYRLISDRTANILGRDMHTEEEFSEYSSVYFDFSEDRIAVNGKTGFSASSLTVLRNAFHLALHWTSCVDNTLRYPRFLLMDNIEDKGMTERRSQNFQSLVQRLVQALVSSIR